MRAPLPNDLSATARRSIAPVARTRSIRSSHARGHEPSNQKKGREERRQKQAAPPAGKGNARQHDQPGPRCVATNILLRRLPQRSIRDRAGRRPPARALSPSSFHRSGNCLTANPRSPALMAPRIRTRPEERIRDSLFSSGSGNTGTQQNKPCKWPCMPQPHHITSFCQFHESPAAGQAARKWDTHIAY